jgi:manganese oxidase
MCLSRFILFVVPWSVLIALVGIGPGVGVGEARASVIKAEVVALDQCFMANRLGTAMPQGIIFSLRRDVVSNDTTNEGRLVPGKVTLRADKRPRPIVLRMNVGDTLEVKFWNLLNPTPGQARARDAQRWFSCHGYATRWDNSIGWLVGRRKQFEPYPSR